MTTFITILPNGKIATRKSAHPYTYAVAVKWPGEDWGISSCHASYENAKAKSKYLLHCPGNIHQMGTSGKSVEVNILALYTLQPTTSGIVS
jgi:hypothetical protein